MSAERILVTGAAGFVGSRLAKRLLDRGETVVGHDNLNDYYAIEHKQRHLADLREYSNFQFVPGDLRDPDALKALFVEHNFDAIAHLAAMAAVRYSIKHPLLYGTVNVQGTANLLDAGRAMSESGRRPAPPRFVLSSTGSVYGKDTPVPFREDAPADHPLAAYPASKRAMELFAHSFNHLYKIPVTVVRFFNVYGPQGRPDMMPWQWSAAIAKGEPITLYNGGHLKRDWTYVDDIVDGFLAALDKPQPTFEIFNLGCGRPVENVDFVRTLEALLGKQAHVVVADAPASEPLITFADISKARAMLGYKPKVMVEEGLRRFVEWLRAERLLPEG